MRIDERHYNAWCVGRARRPPRFLSVVPRNPLAPQVRPRRDLLPPGEVRARGVPLRPRALPQPDELRAPLLPGHDAPREPEVPRRAPPPPPRGAHGAQEPAGALPVRQRAHQPRQVRGRPRRAPRRVRPRAARGVRPLPHGQGLQEARPPRRRDDALHLRPRPRAQGQQPHQVRHRPPRGARRLRGREVLGARGVRARRRPSRSRLASLPRSLGLREVVVRGRADHGGASGPRRTARPRTRRRLCPLRLLASPMRRAAASRRLGAADSSRRARDAGKAASVA